MWTDKIAPEQAISSEQALRGIALDAACQRFGDDWIGSIELGKLADFTVVDQKPLAIDPDALDKIETWLGGRKVMEKPAR